MELEKLKNKVIEGKQNFSDMTFFMPNYLKVNLATRMAIHNLLVESNEDPSKIEGLRILVDYDLEGNEGIIGMGEGPTFTKINF